MASQKRTQVNKQRFTNENPLFGSLPNIRSKVLSSQSESALQSEKLRHERLIGQLKAAEARNR